MWGCWSSASATGVTFQPAGHRPLVGVLTRYNRKTVTVITDDGAQWNVAPSFLSRADAPQGRQPSGSNVILMTKR
ncbi:MAG: hypothetical protein WDN25_19785 [Acetobacteraceae bacterium]